MFIAKQALILEVGYCASANQLVLDACTAITAVEFERDLKASHGSIAGVLRLMYYAEKSLAESASRQRTAPIGRFAAGTKLRCTA